MRAPFLTEPLPVLKKSDCNKPIRKGKQSRPPDPIYTTGQLVDPVMDPAPFSEESKYSSSNSWICKPFPKVIYILFFSEGGREK